MSIIVGAQFGMAIVANWYGVIDAVIRGVIVNVGEFNINTTRFVT